jgi:hypothetical protein
MLDCTVAGAVAFGEMPRETLYREGSEEAGLSEEILEGAEAIGNGEWVLNFYLAPEAQGGYCRSGCGWRFEVELNAGEESRIMDGEAEGFYAMGIEEAKKRLVGDEFMPNAAKVLVDWLVERGHVGVEGIAKRTRRELPFSLMNS